MGPLVRACTVAALFAVSVAPALAQTPASPAPSASPLPEIGRVSTSDRQDEPAGVTAKTTYVVTKSEIVRHGYTTVANAIENLPGVVITRYGAIGAQESVSLRGSSSAQVLVLVDGHPLAGRELGAVDLGALPTTGVERIEVVEGSGSTLYGNGAVGGVINVITRGGAYRTPHLTLGAGSFGERSVSVESAHLSYERRVSHNGYDFPALPGGAPAGTRTNADFAETTLRARGDGDLGGVRVSASAGVVERHQGVPGSTDFLTAGARQDDVTSDARIAFSRARTHATTSLDFSATREQLVYRDDVVAEGGPYLDFDQESRLQASLRNVVAGGADRLVYGADFARGNARNDAGYGQFAVMPFSQSAVYVQDSRQVAPGSRIYGGVRAERDGAQGSAISPALGAIVALGEGLSVRANAGTAFRVPTALDLTYPGFSNPDLRPERTRSFDVTLGDANLLGGVNLGWFVQTGTDLIVVNPAVDFTQPFTTVNEPLINAQRTSIAGFTLDATTRAYHGFVTRLGITDTYRALDLSAAARRLAYRPVIVANLDLGWTGTATSPLAAAGIVAHTVGQRDALGNAPTFTRIDAYTRFRVAPNALVSLRAFDLGNERYAQYAGFPMPGRAFSVELSTR